MSKNKKQHMLQAAYLAGFSPDVYSGSKLAPRQLPLWLLDGASMKIYRTTVGKTSTESYLYSYRRNDGTYNHAVDEAFQKLEKQFTPVMRRISELVSSYASGQRGATLPKDDHVFLIRYLYMYSVRTARIFNWIRNDSRDSISRWNTEKRNES